MCHIGVAEESRAWQEVRRVEEGREMVPKGTNFGSTLGISISNLWHTRVTVMNNT